MSINSRAATAEMQRDSLNRATQNNSLSNYPAIFDGFAVKGIPESEIKPRVNVFTYNAWKAKGRQVKRGEKGVKISTWVPMTRKDADTGEKRSIGRRPKTATVFHVSQTE